jgi:beta-N-acetylhexosaminidase
MVLVSHTPAAQERTWEYLLRAMRDEPLLRERVREGARRVLALKMKTFRGASPFPFIPDPEKLSREIPAPRATGFFFDSTCRGVTLLKKGVIPFRPAPAEKLILIAQYSEFLEEGKKRFPGADTLLYSWHPKRWIDPAEKKRVTEAVDAHDAVVFCLANPTGLRLLRGLRSRAGKIIVVSALTPVYLDELPWVETAVAVYGNAAPAFRAGFAALAGDFTPEGTLPVRFGGK